MLKYVDKKKLLIVFDISGQIYDMGIAWGNHLNIWIMKIPQNLRRK